MRFEEITEIERNLDLSELKGIILAKSKDTSFQLNFEDEELNNKFVLRIPLDRFENENFAFGLTHELTEVTLRKLICSIIENLNLKYKPNFWEIKYLLHEATILSIEKYSIVADSYVCLENDFDCSRANKLEKLPASEKKKFLALESQMNSKSPRTSILSRIKLWIRQYKPF
jgi:hypothetical protein